MKRTLTALVVAGSLAGLAAHASEAEKKLVIAQADNEKAATDAAFTYRPPLRGAPATRVGGGTRSVGARPVTLHVLAPNETGLTTRERPTVYWYISEALTSPVELTITISEPLKHATPPALEITLQPPIAKGVHALRLGDHGITLKPGVEYQWYVAVVGNPSQRSADVVAGGAIQRVANTDAVQRRLDGVPEQRRAAVYAESGIWYDAIDDLSRQISANPADAKLRQQRATLLEQVGLRDAAAFDRETR
jgi:hypothetical protein